MDEETTGHMVICINCLSNNFQNKDMDSFSKKKNKRYKKSNLGNLVICQNIKNRK